MRPYGRPGRHNMGRGRPTGGISELLHVYREQKSEVVFIAVACPTCFDGFLLALRPFAGYRAITKNHFYNTAMKTFSFFQS